MLLFDVDQWISFMMILLLILRSIEVDLDMAMVIVKTFVIPNQNITPLPFSFLKWTA